MSQSLNVWQDYFVCLLFHISLSISSFQLSCIPYFYNQYWILIFALNFLAISQQCNHLVFSVEFAFTYWLIWTFLFWINHAHFIEPIQKCNGIVRTSLFRTFVVIPPLWRTVSVRHSVRSSITRLFCFFFSKPCNTASWNFNTLLLMDMLNFWKRFQIQRASASCVSRT